MRKIDADRLPFMKANLDGINGEFEKGYNKCLKTIQKQILEAPIVPDIELTDDKEDGRYKRYYEGLYNRIRGVIGEERYQRAKEEVLSNGNCGVDTFLVIAIQELMDEVSDGGFERVR